MVSFYNSMQVPSIINFHLWRTLWQTHRSLSWNLRISIIFSSKQESREHINLHLGRCPSSSLFIEIIENITHLDTRTIRRFFITSAEAFWNPCARPSFPELSSSLSFSRASYSSLRIWPSTFLRLAIVTVCLKDARWMVGGGEWNRKLRLLIDEKREAQTNWFKKTSTTTTIKQDTRTKSDLMENDSSQTNAEQ